jgi:hypothetical protein
MMSSGGDRVITIEGRPAIWVLLVERGISEGSNLQLFWHETDAIEGARRHLLGAWTPDELATKADVLKAIEAANQLVGDDEYVTVAPFPIAGNPYFEGTTDHRPRCKACREPIELDDPGDPSSWVHGEDSNDLGDHTAEF